MSADFRDECVGVQTGEQTACATSLSVTICWLGCTETLQFLSKLSVGEAVDKMLSGEDSAEDISVGASEWVERADGTACGRDAPGGEGVELAQGRRGIGNFGEGIEVALVAPE